MSRETGPEFSVNMSSATRERLTELQLRAATDGLRAQFLAALRMILDRLRADPTSYGEELFDLKVMQLTIKVAVEYPVAVEFGVYTESRQVLVRSFRYLAVGE